MGRQYLGDASIDFAYTIRGQLGRIGNLTSTTVPFAALYTYNPNGTMQHAEFRSNGTPAAHKRYRYSPVHDGKNQLTSAQYAYHNGSSYTSSNAYRLNGVAYDLSGNLTTLQRYRENATLIDNLSYTIVGSSNRLSSISDAIGATTEPWDVQTGSFTYDGNGNVITAPAPYGITYSWSDHTNMPQLITSNGTTSTYRYNGESQRIAQQVGSGNTDVYVLEGRTTLGVFSVNGSGTPVSWHFNILAGDRVVGRQPNGSVPKRYYHRDLLGITRAVVQNGTIVESYDYDPWGVLMPGRTLAGPTREGFTGKERDATGLDYFGFRYYMSAVGRWTRVDPPADSFPSWSPYNYVENNPVTFTDPFGLCPESMGGDGATSTLMDCPPGTEGYQRISGGVREAMGPVEAIGLLVGGGLGARAAVSLGSRLFARGATGLATKAAAREAAASLGLRGAQAAGVNSAIGRATATSTIDVVRGRGGSVIVRVMRAGDDGHQVIESTVTRGGTKTVIQRAYDAAGNLVHFDPKR